MKKPIQAGDLAEVISGMLGEKSPNKGLIVKVISRVYECPQLGVVWRCEAEYATQHDTNDLKYYAKLGIHGRNYIYGAWTDFLKLLN